MTRAALALAVVVGCSRSSTPPDSTSTSPSASTSTSTSVAPPPPSSAASAAVESEPTDSPAKDATVFVRGGDLWIRELPGRQESVLVHGAHADDPKANLTGIQSPTFSPDGATLYFLTEAWPNSFALHAVDRHTGKARFLLDGSYLVVIPDGKHRGQLVVGRHENAPGDGGAFDSVWLVGADGKPLRRLKKLEPDEDVDVDRLLGD